MSNFEGKGIRTKMNQTIVVAIDFTFRHKKYGKIIKKTTKLHVHNEIAEIKIGDKVKIGQSKPYSKTVHFKVLAKLAT